MAKRFVKLNQQQRLAKLKPSTYNEEKRTMEVVFSTGARVMRSSWGGRYAEELDMNKKSVRLGRFKAGAPVLDSHNRYSLNSVLGVVEDARIEDGKGIAVIRFSEREAIQPIIQDIRSGVIKNVSVGYITHKMREDKEDNDLRVFRAVDWEPTEVSFVTVPADAAAQSRNETVESDCEIEFLGERSADDETEAEIETTEENAVSGGEINSKDRAEVSSMDPEELKRLQEEAIAAERKRSQDIKAAVKKAKLDDDFAERLISDGTEIGKARELIIDALAERDDQTATVSTVEVGTDISRESTREGCEGAILHRYDKAAYPLNDNSGRFVNRNMVEIAKECLRVAGVRGYEGLNNHQVIKMALRGPGHHSSSDYPIILENIMTKTVQKGYAEAPRTWEPIARQTTVSDFKQVSRVHLGEFTQLEQVLEGGEYKAGTVGERGEKYSISKYGKKICVTWEMLVNDDISAFTSIPAKMGKKARDLESDKVWAVLIDNTQVMAETSVALFHANHNNLNEGGAGAVDEAALAGIREAMRLHQDLGGTSPLNLFPSYIFVPASREVETTKLLTSITPNQSSQVNVFGQNSGFFLRMAVEPRLDVGNKPWFVTADSSQVDMLEVARLAGEESPMVESRDGFDVDGVEFKIRHLFVAHAIDYRGFQRNDGA